MSLVGKRINYDGNLGIVLYEGPVTNSNIIWLGIQWDDPSRGKHNGEYKGVKYFTPTIENSASFIKKNSPSLQVGQSFQEALIKKYIIKEEKDKNAEPVVWGKVVETVGFEKIDKKQSHLNELIEVGLDFQNIEKAFTDNDTKGKIKEICPNIEELNLSNNLFTHWDDVFDILNELEQLSVLFLNKNKINPNSLTSITRNNNAKFNSIKTLSLNKSIDEWEIVKNLEPYFPNLENISLGFNNFTNLLPILQPNQFSALKSINLESNALASWTVIENTLGKLPSLETLKMDYNKIKSIQYTLGTFEKLETLNLNNNEIDNWETIIELDKFPSLQKLRLSRNPLGDSVEPAANYRIFVIGRISKLIQFNGSSISKSDRYDCERYYINYAYQEKQKMNWSEEEFTIKHPKFKEL
ncbi:RNI-like protein, partial [Anaeromyces robustus]